MKVTFEQPQFTVDSILFTVSDEALQVLLVKRAEEPFVGHWSLPGGFVDLKKDKDTQATAIRKLKLKAGITPQYLEQLRVYDGSERDPRGFSVTLAYYALVASEQAQPNIASVNDAKWFSISEIEQMSLAFDHNQIVNDAFQRLKQKALYSMIPLYCCAERFTLLELQTVIETIIGKPIQRKTLMRRVEQSEMLEPLGEKSGNLGRKAQLYQVRKGVDIYHFERNLEV